MARTIFSKSKLHQITIVLFLNFLLIVCIITIFQGPDYLFIRTLSHNIEKLKFSSERLQSKDRALIQAELPCDDSTWCSIPMPPRSHYSFDSPDDPVTWNRAQRLSATNRQTLLESIRKVFNDNNDFLDGDTSFRGIHSYVDIFVDSKSRLNELYHLTNNQHKENRVLITANEETNLGSYDRRLVRNKVRKKSSSKSKLMAVNEDLLLPVMTDFRSSKTKRAPVVSLGYGKYFSGRAADYKGLDMETFLRKWNEIKDNIDVPFVALCQGNENWGCLSTWFPNRTAGWGKCCSQPKYQLLFDFLNHPKTLMFVINQHHNISHPKLLVLPRGLPITWKTTAGLVYDTMQYAPEHIRKRYLLFAASSNWGKRPQIIRCISQSMSNVDEFFGHSSRLDDPAAVLERQEMKSDRKLYYEKLVSSKFGLALPGLGYDCFRTWELLTLGTIAIVERGVGLDRSLFRLPALLIDDFADITPTLLRSAYVEAIYRDLRHEFDYNKLKQSYWYGILTNVSLLMNNQNMFVRFPVSVEDGNFTRPRDRFNCDEIGGCSKGTKRTPKRSCP